MKIKKMNPKNQAKSVGKTLGSLRQSHLEAQNLWWNIWADIPKKSPSAMVELGN